VIRSMRNSCGSAVWSIAAMPPSRHAMAGSIA
jgi:hypothetical protein